MISEIKKSRDLVETEKMMNIIHENAQKARDKYIISKNLKTIKCEKNDKQRKWVLILAIAFVYIFTIVTFIAYENKQNDKCVAAGHDKNWCVIKG